MGMAIFSPQGSRAPALAMLLAPLNAFIALFMPAQTRSTNNPAFARPDAARAAGKTPHGHPLDVAPWRGVTSTPVIASSRRAKKVSRLKIVRAVDPGVAPSCAGRMVISGRMADVCAELERLAQGEASKS